MTHVGHVPDFAKQVARDLALNSEIVLVRQRGNLSRIEERNRGGRPLTERNRSKRRRQRLAGKCREAISQAKHAFELGLSYDVAGGVREPQSSGITDGVAYGLAV